MIKGIYLNGTEDLTEVYSIRNEVFTKEMNIPADIENDGEDMMAMHAILDYKGQKVATARMRFDGDTFELDKVAVLKEHRKNGYADFVVRMLLDKVFTSNGKVIIANATVDSVPFFESIGFIPNGEQFEKDGVKLQPMKVEYGKVKTQCGGHH